LEGWKVLCRGWTPTILRDAPFSALYFMIFIKLKNITLQEGKYYKIKYSEMFYIFLYIYIKCFVAWRGALTATSCAM